MVLAPRGAPNDRIGFSHYLNQRPRLPMVHEDIQPLPRATLIFVQPGVEVAGPPDPIGAFYCAQRCLYPIGLHGAHVLHVGLEVRSHEAVGALRALKRHLEPHHSSALLSRAAHHRCGPPLSPLIGARLIDEIHSEGGRVNAILRQAGKHDDKDTIGVLVAIGQGVEVAEIIERTNINRPVGLGESSACRVPLRAKVFTQDLLDVLQHLWLCALLKGERHDVVFLA
mmetsp:Transcript_16736/g.35515  ORF Transcript_16736/g.35515 Transcript_16736/m.35515 type:complete len:226 (-) Transcript_16736:562-1239(-)